MLGFAQTHGRNGGEGVGIPDGCSSPEKRPTKASSPGLGRRREPTPSSRRERERERERESTEHAGEGES